MKRDERIEMISIMIDGTLIQGDELMLACQASDIDAQIALLQKYKRSRLDILGRLPNCLAQRIMLGFEVPQMLRLKLVGGPIRD